MNFNLCRNDCCNPLEETKYIVSESMLMELFNVCRRCHRLATPTTHQRVGTMVKIAAECEFCGFTWLWCSQPHVGSIPAGNIGLSASILFSGALPSKVLRVLRCMGVATITQRTFSNHQASLLFPAVARVWDRQQRDYCKRMIFSVYDIRRNFIFWLFSVDLNWRFILINLIIPK